MTTTRGHTRGPRHRRLRRARPGSRPARSARDGWQVVTDARHGDVLAGRDRWPPPHHRDRRRRHRPASPGSARRGGTSPRPARPARPQRERARPDAAAGRRRCPTSSREVLATNVLAPLCAHAAAAAASCAHPAASWSASPATRPSSTTRRGARTRASKAALDHLILTLAAENGLRGVRRRPRRPAHGDAPAGVPGRGHLRPAAAGDRRPAPPVAARPATAPSGRYRAGRPRRGGALDDAPRRAPRHPVPRPPTTRPRRRPRSGAGTPATRCGCSWRDPRRHRAHAASATSPRTSSAGDLAGRQRLRHRAPASSTPPSSGADRSSCTSRSRLAPDDAWVVELRTAPDARRAVLDAEPGDVVRERPAYDSRSRAVPAAGRPRRPAAATGCGAPP